MGVCKIKGGVGGKGKEGRGEEVWGREERGVWGGEKRVGGRGLSYFSIDLNSYAY